MIYVGIESPVQPNPYLHELRGDGLRPELWQSIVPESCRIGLLDTGGEHSARTSYATLLGAIAEAARERVWEVAIWSSKSRSREAAQRHRLQHSGWSLMDRGATSWAWREGQRFIQGKGLVLTAPPDEIWQPAYVLGPSAEDAIAGIADGSARYFSERYQVVLDVSTVRALGLRRISFWYLHRDTLGRPGLIGVGKPFIDLARVRDKAPNAVVEFDGSAGSIWNHR